MLEILSLENFPIIKEKDNIGKIIIDSLKENKIELLDNDVLIIAQTIISRAEGMVINLDEIEPSDFAKEIALHGNKDPKHVEVILKEAKNICKFRNGVLVTETKHGFVCANSGVDKSNVPSENTVTVLPKDSDQSAKKIREQIEEKLKKKIAVIISDTHNRPFRLGAINIAIGCSGINPLNSYIGKKDLFGYELKSSIVSTADQLCGAAGLIMGESAEGYPVILIRGLNYQRDEISAKVLIRPEEKDYFR